MKAAFLKITATVLSFVAFGAATAAYSSENVKIQTFPTHSRLFFSLDPSIPAELKRTPKGFEIIFKGISLSDLGAPLGEEEAWQNQFVHAGDSRLLGLKFAEVAGGVKAIGTWKFPEGKDALVNPQMESFDFRQANPSPGYLVDFWLKKGSMTLAEWKKHQKEQARLEAIRKNEEAKRLKAERRIASEKRRAEVEDTTKFCREPLSERNDVFLQLYPVHQKVEFKRWLPTTTPDANLPYEEPAGKGKDAQYVRLALSLYRQGKFALVTRTLDFFETEHPKSQYRTEMKFLRANALIKLGYQHDADEILHHLRSEAKDTPFALESALYAAYQQIESGQVLAATETFLWLISHFPDHPNVWEFHLGAAESLYALKQMDRALKEYEWVLEKAPNAEAKAEAALRQADLFMARFQYDQALAGYFQAAHYFPEQAQKFAPVHINRAEALYGLGQWDRAKEAFIAFLKDFPGNSEGWRATYRLGEIDGRKAGADSQNDSRKWFYETINAFPFSAGAQLARLRLMPCGDHGGFTLEAAEHFFSTDLSRFDPKTEIQMIPFHAFETLTHVRTLIAFNKEPQAVDLATDELKRPGNLELHERLRASLGGVFRKSILELLAAGKRYEALTFYKEKADYLPKAASTPEESDYLLKLSQAASDLGLGDLAKQIADFYAKSNTGRAVAETTSPDVESRLTASEQHFTQAKALWVASGMKEEKAIRAHLAQVLEESHFSYERELILGLMDQKSKKESSALAHAIQAQMLMPAPEARDASGDLRVNAWIAELQAHAGDTKVALEMYRNLEKHVRLQAKTTQKTDVIAANLGVPPMPPLDVVILAQGGLLEKHGLWGEAAAIYGSAVEEKIGGNQALFQYARSLSKTGVAADRQRAHAVLEKLASSQGQDDFWKKLARESLADDNTGISKP